MEPAQRGTGRGHPLCLDYEASQHVYRISKIQRLVQGGLGEKQKLSSSGMEILEAPGKTVNV